MSKGKKIAVALTRAFAGIFGVDFFIMGKISSGVLNIVITLILSILPFPLALLNLIPDLGLIIYSICNIIISIYFLIRILCFLVSGLMLLRKTPEEVEARY